VAFHGRNVPVTYRRCFDRDDVRNTPRTGNVRDAPITAGVRPGRPDNAETDAKPENVFGGTRRARVNDRVVVADYSPAAYPGEGADFYRSISGAGTEYGPVTTIPAVFRLVRHNTDTPQRVRTVYIHVETP